MEIIHIILQILILVYQIVVLDITMINIIVRYVIPHVKLEKINQINLVRVVLQMEDIHITIKYCQHVLIHARSVIINLITYAWRVILLVLRVQI